MLYTYIVSCISGDLRLGGYPVLAPFAGVLQIFINGQWGAIEDSDNGNADNWDVACQQLFGVDNYQYAYSYFNSFWVQHKYPIIAGDFACDGTEQRLIDCDYDSSSDGLNNQHSVFITCNVQGM